MWGDKGALGRVVVIAAIIDGLISYKYCAMSEKEDFAATCCKISTDDS